MNTWVLVLTTWLSAHGGQATSVVIEPVGFFKTQVACERRKLTQPVVFVPNGVAGQPRHKLECVFNGV